jgi:hypothetical protein
MKTTKTGQPSRQRKFKVVAGQPSCELKSDQVEAFLTRTGAQLGPITFRLNGRKVMPYSVAPWATEKEAEKLEPILRVLRGDFFCMPFGGNARPVQGRKFPIHGETANEEWAIELLKPTAGRVGLCARLDTRVRPGHVDRYVFLRKGDTAVYSQTVVSGMSGSMSFGHHAMLKFPEAEGSGLISTSPFVYGQVHPTLFENPAGKGYSSLKVGAEFSNLKEVPMANGEAADLSCYPARRGFEDLVMLASDPNEPIGWTAVSFPKERYVWFALKDPRILRQTVLWHSNGGRHYYPWNGRHVGVLGLEEVTSYFAYGLAESVSPNPVIKCGIPTAVKLNPRRPLVIPYVMAVAATPPGFDHVKEIAPANDRKAVTLVSRSGKKVKAAVDLAFFEAGAGWD